MDPGSCSKELYNEILLAIQVNFSPESSNESRQEAIKKLNSFIQFEDAHHSSERTLELAHMLIESAVPESNQLVEYAVYYGLKLWTQIVKFKWQTLSREAQDILAQFCLECCRTNSIRSRAGVTVGIPIQSPLVLNATTQFICEIFMRTYPAQWPAFIQDCTQAPTILGPAIFHNLSIMINELIIPKNPSRRKEIVSYLYNDKAILYQYFARILVLSDDEAWLPVAHKSLQTLESLFQWFPLDESIMQVLLMFYGRLFASLVVEKEDPDRRIVLIQAFYDCILSTVQRPNVNRLDDVLIIEKIFYTLKPDSCIQHLIQQCLPFYFYDNEIMNTPTGLKLSMTCMEIIVEILVHCLELHNKNANNEATKNEFSSNQALWGSFLTFVPSLLSMNNALLDEILLKFLLFYSRLSLKPEATGNSQSEGDNGNNNGDKSSGPFTPIQADVHEEFLMNVLKKIVLYKNEPLPEDQVSLSSMNLEDYESYSELFRLNRVKFISFLIAVCDNSPITARNYVMNLIGFMLGPVTTYEKSVTVPNWNCFTFMIQTMFPRLEFESAQIEILQWNFQKLLSESSNEEYSTDSRTNMLSCLSAMSTLYRHFDPSLIRCLLERIFDFALVAEPKFSHHASNLFIRLSLERAPILIDHFDNLRTHSDNLFRSQQISHSQYIAMLEGLIILSNHFKEPSKQQKFLVLVLDKIQWVRSYDFGVNGINFARDSGLSQPYPDSGVFSQKFKMNEFFMNFKSALRLLMAIFTRLNPKITPDRNVPAIFDYIFPYLKFLSALNYYWKLWKDGHHDELAKYISPCYFEPFFEEMPYELYSNILQDHKFLLQDRNTLVKKHKLFEISKTRETYLNAFSWYVANRFQELQVFSFNLITSCFNYLFVFQQTHPNPSFFLNHVWVFCHQLQHSCDSLPLIYSHSFLIFLLNLASCMPRTPEFLHSKDLITFLNDNLLNFFNRMHPWFDGQKPDLGNDHIMEIIVESLYTIFSNKFVNVLYFCQNEKSFLQNWMAKFEKHSEIEDDFDMELVEAMNDCSIASKLHNEDAGSNKMEILLNLMINDNWKISEVILKLLKWPIQRDKICTINQQMVTFLLDHNILNSVEKVIVLFRSILEAISITELSESSVINRLVKLFSMIYEKIARTGYSVPFNFQLSELTGVDVHEWNRYASDFGGSEASLKNSRSEAQRLKSLRKLLESLCRKPISQQHVVEKPNIEALFKAPVKKNQPDVLDFDSSIAALFGDS